MNFQISNTVFTTIIHFYLLGISARIYKSIRKYANDTFDTSSKPCHQMLQNATDCFCAGLYQFMLPFVVTPMLHKADHLEKVATPLTSFHTKSWRTTAMCEIRRLPSQTWRLCTNEKGHAVSCIFASYEQTLLPKPTEDFCGAFHMSNFQKCFPRINHINIFSWPLGESLCE